MSVIECLFYTPGDMDELIDFAKNGKKKPNGEYEIDEDGQKMTGVINWLLGRGVREAYFFNNGVVFASTVQKPENEPPDRPWMKEIPGFDVVVKTDGLIGTTENFAPITDLLASLLASVQTNDDLDATFAAERENADRKLESIRRENTFSFGEEEFLAALRGDKGSDLQAVLAEIEKTSGFSLEATPIS